MSMSLGEFSPPSSPSSSPPLSPQYMGESQPQRDCRELLKDPDGTNLFRAYLKGAYASEVLNLWIEIQLYKNIGEQEKMQKKGQYIYDKYCCREGACEVNLDESLRVAVKMALDNSTLQQTTFNNIQTHVFDLLWTDCFMGFRHTDVYSKYITQRNSLGMFLVSSFPRLHPHRTSPLFFSLVLRICHTATSHLPPFVSSSPIGYSFHCRTMSSSSYYI